MAAQLVADLTSFVDQGYTILTWNGVGFDFNILREESCLTSQCRKLAAAPTSTCYSTSSAIWATL